MMVLVAENHVGCGGSDNDAQLKTPVTKLPKP